MNVLVRLTVIVLQFYNSGNHLQVLVQSHLAHYPEALKQKYNMTVPVRCVHSNITLHFSPDIRTRKCHFPK